MSYESPVAFVILSTYNGERFLREQLNSLLNQTYKNIRIIVRDDGSKDKTREILSEYSQSHKNVDILFEDNIGVVGSFLRLLELVPPEADYVALCDQDDVWSADKIERAISLLNKADATSPLMYCGAVEIVDENLAHMRNEKLVKRPAVLENALVQNVAIGCTTVINRAALQLVQHKKVSVAEILMHDWWLYQVISAFGTVLFDDVSKIQYRQHGGNVIGSSSGVRLLVDRIKRHLGPKNRAIRRQATELLRAYGPDMCTHNYKIVGDFLEQTRRNNLAGRLAYALRTPVYRQSRVDDLVLRVLIVFSRI